MLLVVLTKKMVENKKEKAESRKKQNLRVEVVLPEGVAASVAGNILLVKGPKGEVKRELKQKNVSVKVEAQKIIFET